MEQPSSRPESGAVEFDNPPVAEDISAPDRRHLRGCVVNFLIVVAAFSALAFALDLAANHLTPFIPFRWEKKLLGKNLLQSSLDDRGKAKQNELRRLASRLAAAMDFPGDVDVTVFYNSDRVVNAFATFGGNIVFFQGLLNLMDSEDELAMVLAHEMAHVKHRDVMRGIVRAFGFVMLSIGLQDGGSFVGQLSGWEMAGYGRGQETEADLAAVRALGVLYGHAGGAAEFFQSLAVQVEHRQLSGKRSIAGLNSSHPDTLHRYDSCREEAKRLGIPFEGELTPLPEPLN